MHSGTLLETKLHQPQSHIDLIPRPRLLEQMDRCLETPLTLVSAPAGFGKTTLITQWHTALRQRRNAPHLAWLSVDERDNDPVVFLSYFIAAIQTIYPEACPKTRERLRSQEIASDLNLITLLVNELDELTTAPAEKLSEHLVLVLDDFDVIRNEAANQLIHLLTQFPPPRLHLVLTCRRDPLLPLSQLKARRKLVEIRSRDLRLTRPEILAFAQQFLDWNENDRALDLLEDKSEGWFAILHLMAMVMRNDSADHLLALMPDQQQDIVNYLVDEVLARVHPQMRECLVRLSIPEKFSASLSETICEQIGDGDKFLQELFASNLFVLALDSDGIWFRFHHLFRQILLNQLKLKYTRAEQEALHRRAAAWFREHDLPEETIAHALAGQDVPTAVAVVARYRHELMNNEEWNRLNQWINQFPTQHIDEYPDLLLAKAWLAHFFHFDLAFMEHALRQTRLLLKRNNLSPEATRTLRAECDSITHTLAFLRDNSLTDNIQSLQRALQGLPLKWYLLRSQTRMTLAFSHYTNGDAAQARRCIQDGLPEDTLTGTLPRARNFATFGFLYWIEGNMRALKELANQTLYLAEPQGWSESTLWAHYLLACALYEKNDLAGAETAARTVFNSTNRGARVTPLLFAAIILASVQQAHNQPGMAHKTLDEVAQILLERRSTIFMQVLDAFRAELAVRQGDIESAAHWLETREPMLPRNINLHLFYPHQLAAAKVLLAINTPAALARAETLLQDRLSYFQQIHHTHFLVQTLALQALVYDAQGKAALAQQTLKQAVQIAASGNLVRSFLDLGPQLLPLLQKLTAQGIAPNYLAAILATELKARKEATKESALVNANSMLTQLTDRERDVLELLAQRMSNKEIASQLFISPLTVKVHTDHIYQKLNVSNRREAVQTAYANGLLNELALPT